MKIPFRILMALCLIIGSVYVGILVIIRLQIGHLKDLRLPNTPISIIKLSERPAKMYKAYLRGFGKHYEGEEVKKRFEIFKNSLKEISRLNGQAGATYNVTKFSDVVREELMFHRVNDRICRSWSRSCPPHSSTSFPRIDSSKEYQNVSIPMKFDWRDEGVVGPVLDQKRCNGCWAFGIVGVMESQAAILNGKFGPRRSIQELIDCSGREMGCSSGHVATALNKLCDTQLGIVTEEEYPLKLIKQPFCPYKTGSRGSGLRLKHFEYKCGLNGKESYILELVANHGPVMVVVNADTWRNYIDGVIQRECSRSPSDTLLHVVQIVGYDLTADVPHYIVRNSWGEDFGDGGYVKLAYGSNTCGLADELSYLDVYP